MVALTSGPEFSVLLFAVNKNQVLSNNPIKAIEGQKFTHCFYHSREDDLVVVIGTGAIKTLKIMNDPPIKPKDVPFAKKDSKEF